MQNIKPKYLRKLNTIITLLNTRSRQCCQVIGTNLHIFKSVHHEKKLPVISLVLYSGNLQRNKQVNLNHMPQEEENVLGMSTYWTYSINWSTIGTLSFLFLWGTWGCFFFLIEIRTKQTYPVSYQTKLLLESLKNKLYRSSISFKIIFVWCTMKSVQSSLSTKARGWLKHNLCLYSLKFGINENLS